MLTCGCVVGPGYPHSVPGGSHSPPFCVVGFFQQTPLWVQKSTGHSRHPLPSSACAIECLTCTRVFPEVPGPLLIDPVQVTCRAWGWFALMVAMLLCTLGLAWRGTPLTLAQCSLGQGVSGDPVTVRPANEGKSTCALLPLRQPGLQPRTHSWEAPEASHNLTWRNLFLLSAFPSSWWYKMVRLVRLHGESCFWCDRRSQAGRWP